MWKTQCKMSLQSLDNSPLAMLQPNIQLWKSWGIKEVDINSAMTTLAKMKHSLENQDFSFENIDHLYAQWEFIASRLNKGKSYVDDPYYKKQEEATYQYQFLLTLLGIYDYFFKSAIDEVPHKLLQNSILNIVDY